MILMMCTGAKGGMLSVVEGYRRCGLIDDCHVRLIFTHYTGSLTSRLLISLRSLGSLLRALVFNHVTGVHLHAATRGSFWRKSIFGLVSRWFGARVVYHLHGSEMKPFIEGLTPWARAIAVMLLERADAVIVLSDSWHQYVSKLAPRARLRLIPNFIEVGALPPFNPGEQVRFLFLGELGKRKGIYDLLPAFAKGLETNPAMRLIVGGDGELLECRELAEKLGLSSKIEFLGWISGDSKQHALANADAFVLPSYNEGLAMSILEAMAHGLPVISTRVGGIPQAVLNGRTGLLFDAGDKPALTAALLTIASSPELRREMGAAGHSLALAEFSDLAVVPKIKCLYKELGME